MKAAREWLPRIAFAASLFALLGTSKPRGWTAETAAPDAAPPPPGQAELVTVEASDTTTVRTVDRFGTLHQHQANGPRMAGGLLRTVLLLAPGARFSSASMEGSCGKSGLFGDGKCAPPASAIVTARATRVAVWSRELTFVAKVHVPKSTNMRAVRIALDNVPSNAEVSVASARPVLIWSGKETVVESGFAGGYDSYVLGTHFEDDADAELIVHVTAFGPCPDPGLACPVPTLVPAPTLVSVTIAP